MVGAAGLVRAMKVLHAAWGTASQARLLGRLLERGRGRARPRSLRGLSAGRRRQTHTACQRWGILSGGDFTKRSSDPHSGDACQVELGDRSMRKEPVASRAQQDG
eukprot:scaffold51292_cov57-Phaeocystis_antarctica.AAC.2